MAYAIFAVVTTEGLSMAQFVIHVINVLWELVVFMSININLQHDFSWKNSNIYLTHPFMNIWVVINFSPYKYS